MLTIFEFTKCFPDEDACFKYFYQLKWPNGFVCPHCDHEAGYFLKNRKLMQCKKCKHQTSVTANTVFHKMRIPLLTIVWACYWISTTKKGIAARGCNGPGF